MMTCSYREKLQAADLTPVEQSLGVAFCHFAEVWGGSPKNLEGEEQIKVQNLSLTGGYNTLLLFLNSNRPKAENGSSPRLDALYELVKESLGETQCNEFYAEIMIKVFESKAARNLTSAILDRIRP